VDSIGHETTCKVLEKRISRDAPALALPYETTCDGDKLRVTYTTLVIDRSSVTP
jgi:hypothetical protein